LQNKICLTTHKEKFRKKTQIATLVKHKKQHLHPLEWRFLIFLQFGHFDHLSLIGHIGYFGHFGQFANFGHYSSTKTISQGQSRTQNY
jgi:hypothetical protein